MNLLHPGRTPTVRLFYILFFISGASSLTYEIVWQRMMMLHFGASAPATASILTSFFFGIALGSWIGGKILLRMKNVFLFYGLTELLIAISAISVPLLFSIADYFYLNFSNPETATQAWSFGSRFLLSILVVLPATLGMGATVPAMNRILHEEGHEVGNSVAAAYGFNTLGAVTGCLLAGFVFIKYGGMANTLTIAEFLNVGVMAGAFILSRIQTNRPVTPVSTPERKVFRALPPYLPALLVGLYVLNGAIALAFEITWLRILAIFNTNSIFTLTLALSTYLIGFSIGSLILFPRVAGKIRGLTIFFLSNFGTGVSALLLIPLFYYAPEITSRLVTGPAETSSLWLLNLILSETLISMLIMFVPTIFMGLAFPALCHTLIQGGESIEAKSGFYYSLGNLGAAVAVPVSALYLLPKAGLVGTLGILCTVSLTLALMVSIVDHDLPQRRLIQGLLILLMVFAVNYSGNGTPFVAKGHLVMDMGSWRTYNKGFSTKILRYKTGTTSTVSVKDKRAGINGMPERVLYVDDQGVASDALEAQVDAKMLAHLPLLLHPEPETALTVGFGSGGTSWSMTTHGIQVDAVEIEPEVINSARWFTSQNFNVLQEKNFRLIINDARDHLKTTKKTYDIISTDVTNLQYKQNGSLYTREYFKLIKDRLSDDGIACVWTPGYHISQSELKILMRTFRAEFPQATLWYFNHTPSTFFILIGTKGELKIDMERIVEGFKNEEVKKDLKRIFIDHPYQIPQFLYLGSEGYGLFAGEGPLHTDDRPILDFTSPINFYQAGESLMARNEEMGPYRERSPETLITRLSKSDLPLFRKHTEFYQNVDLFNRLYFFSKPTSKEESLKQREKVSTAARSLNNLFPNHPLTQQINRYFKSTPPLKEDN